MTRLQFWKKYWEFFPFFRDKGQIPYLPPAQKKGDSDLISRGDKVTVPKLVGGQDPGRFAFGVGFEFTVFLQ